MICLVILFIPIRRYTLPASLPFNLEPYRLLVAFVAVAWFTSLLIDPRVRFRRTGIDLPLMCFFFVVLIGLIVNHQRVGTVSSEVYKKLAFFASFFILVYLIASVLRHAREIELIVSLLTVGGAVLAVFAVIERRSGYNVFNHLQTVLPFLHLDAANVPSRPAQSNGTTSRLCIGSAFDRSWRRIRHALPARALPCSYACARAMALVARRWPPCHGGAFDWFAHGRHHACRRALRCFIWLRAKEMRRLVATVDSRHAHDPLVAPGALGTVRASFFPSGGLISEQQDAQVGSGRLATLGPALDAEFNNPLVGEGFGTRVIADTDVAKQTGNDPRRPVARESRSRPASWVP